MNEDEIKEMFDYINSLSPWNLWHPNDRDKPVKERRFNDKVIHYVNKIKK